MRRESAHIPLFLWIATALVVHAVGGGGATTAANRLAETLDIESFATAVRRQASYAGPPVEVSLVNDEQELEELLAEPEPEAPTPQPKPASKQDDPALTAKNEPKKKPEQAPEPKKKPEEKPEKKLDAVAQEQAKIQPPVVDRRRVAVDQDVADKNQEDNETAEFAAEHANRVKEQTRARISSSDGSTSQAQMGGPSSAAGPDVGNAVEDKFGQQQASAGRKDAAPGEMSPEQAARSVARAQAGQDATAGMPQSAPGQNAAPTSNGQKAQQAQAALDAKSASPETMTAEGGSYAVARAQREQAAAQAQKAQRALARMLSEKPPAMFGLGSPSRTPGGVNLNLSVQGATGVLGADRLAAVRKKDGERRLAQHRGSWQSLGLERWRPALENYVANVKPGNQTALNTAREPFARYLNQIHQRLHELFADLFLGHLDQLPKEHPLNNQDMSTHLEIALNKEDGRVVRMGITKSSGVTAFDVGALDSVERAAPYGPPPSAILSSDGNVYLHWEFHRRPELACSTYFARPFIIDLGQTPTTPGVEPPKKPSYEQEGPAPSDKKSGALDKQLDQPPQAKLAQARAAGSRQP